MDDEDVIEPYKDYPALDDELRAAKLRLAKNLCNGPISPFAASVPTEQLNPTTCRALWELAEQNLISYGFCPDGVVLEGSAALAQWRKAQEEGSDDGSDYLLADISKNEIELLKALWDGRVVSFDDLRDTVYRVNQQDASIAAAIRRLEDRLQPLLDSKDKPFEIVIKNKRAQLKRASLREY